MSFRPGQRVRVASRAHEGHHRTPAYLKGKTGRVERLHGSFRNPEVRAYGGDGLPMEALYQVSFGHGPDLVCADVYEHWLEAPQ